MKLTNVFLCIGLMTSANLLANSSTADDSIETGLVETAQTSKEITESQFIEFLSDLFAEYKIPGHRVSIYYSTKTATITLSTHGRRDDAYILIDGQEIKLTDHQTTMLSVLFGTLEVPSHKINGLDSYKTATIHSETIMCNPPVWSLNY